MKKNLVKILITISVFLSIIFIGCIILMVWFLHKDSFHNDTTSSTSISKNIPEKYQGTWINYTYYYGIGTEMDYIYTLNISKDEFKSSVTDNPIKHEVIDGTLSIQFSDRDYKQYLLLDNDCLYLSDNKVIDDKDVCYYKEGSLAEKDDFLESRANYYANNIEVLANSALKETLNSNDQVYLFAEENLTTTQQQKKNNSNDYYALYDSKENTAEIFIDKSTGQLKSLIFSRNFSSSEDLDSIIQSSSSILYGVGCLIYADSLNERNINTADSEIRKTSRMYASNVVISVLQNQSEEGTKYSFDDDYAKYQIFNIINYDGSGTIKMIIEKK